MVQKAAWKLDQGMPCGTEANMAKWLAAEAGFTQRTRLCRPQGFGYAREYHVERYWRGGPSDEARAYFSGNDFELYLEHELGLPRS